MGYYSRLAAQFDSPLNCSATLSNVLDQLMDQPIHEYICTPNKPLEYLLEALERQNYPKAFPDITFRIKLIQAELFERARLGVYVIVPDQDYECKETVKE